MSQRLFSGNMKNIFNNRKAYLVLRCIALEGYRRISLQRSFSVFECFFCLIEWLVFDAISTGSKLACALCDSSITIRALLLLHLAIRELLHRR